MEESTPRPWSLADYEAKTNVNLLKDEYRSIMEAVAQASTQRMRHLYLRSALALHGLCSSDEQLLLAGLRWGGQ